MLLSVCSVGKIVPMAFVLAVFGKVIFRTTFMALHDFSIFTSGVLCSAKAFSRGTFLVIPLLVGKVGVHVVSREQEGCSTFTFS